MKYVMRYETSPEGIARAKENFPAHRQRLSDFHARGVLLMAGPVFGPRDESNPGNSAPPEGALGIFTTREAAEEFVKGDPFVLNGVVSNWSIREWNEVLA